ncbi:YidC/Oxa1 family membrane protein insertase [Streptomyces sp. TRM66268-LWL]|uniref:Membrane protein insertase YidC n=1 Tax=Streptomyces polyasparticus TaxID=2767826 RepID=A0ABR7SNN6_9ACTN|nr:YidC/Oxa1 family membrane protein insertase [Streptomyces polyasparticus]MBC9717090.1 YidC/Oxa1 family membrane protein insertase [Streptomyces polyasparticus]
MSFFSGFADVVDQLADVLHPLFQGASVAVAIILFTMAVRLAVHPLSRAAARGQKARTKLAPQLAELRKKHGKNPEKLQREMLELHKREGVSPLSGCLPSLLQLPAFFLMYHLFSTKEIGGEANPLLGHSLGGAPLAGRFHDALADGGLFGGAGLVYIALFLLVTAVATFNYRRTKQQMATAPAPTGEAAPGMGAMLKFMPLMSFLTLFTVAVVPLAAALYVVTSTTWSAAERYFLYRDAPPTALAAAM